MLVCRSGFSSHNVSHSPSGATVFWPLDFYFYMVRCPAPWLGTKIIKEPLLNSRVTNVLSSLLEGIQSLKGVWHIYRPVDIFSTLSLICPDLLILIMVRLFKFPWLRAILNSVWMMFTNRDSHLGISLRLPLLDLYNSTS